MVHNIDCIDPFLIVHWWEHYGGLIHVFDKHFVFGLFFGAKTFISSTWNISAQIYVISITNYY